MCYPCVSIAITCETIVVWEKSFHSPVENLSAYLHAKFKAFTAITQKLVLFLVNMCKDCVHPI